MTISVEECLMEAAEIIEGEMVWDAPAARAASKLQHALSALTDRVRALERESRRLANEASCRANGAIPD